MKKLLLHFLLLTISSVLIGQTVVDLTDNDDPYGLYDAINSASGPTEVLLNPDVEYAIESRRVSYTLIVRTAPENPPARIKFASGSGNANFWMGEVDVDSIVFDNVELVGEGYGTYVFNNGNDYSVGKVSFTNCKIQSVGGVWRGKAASGTIGDFVIDNCVLDSIGEYTVFRPQGGNFTTSFTLSNSTVNYAMGIVRASEKINTVNIENVTIHQACDADFWINAMFTFYEGFDELTFDNVLVGPGINGDVGAIEDGAEAPGNITVTNSYYTSDFTQATGMELPGDFTAYAGTAADLWADPSSADFTIVDSDFDAKFTTGDPWWIPAQLSELSISVGELSTEFDPSVLSYTSELPDGTEAVVVTAVAKHDGVTVSGDGVIDVSSGSGTANIQVLEGTVSQTYTIEFTVLVGVDEESMENVRLFYNATNDEVVFENHGSNYLLEQVEIFNLNGQLMRKSGMKQSGERTTISTNDLDEGGMYLVRGSYSNGKTVSLRFIK